MPGNSNQKGALSLFETSKRQCLRLSYLLDDVGEAPYELVEPILRKVSAKQLAQIEKKSPQIFPKSQALWKAFISRDFPDRPIPETSYKKTYLKYYRQKATQLEDASSRLRESMERFKREKAARTITSLEVDPRVERALKRQKQTTGGYASVGSGSRLLQKAFQTAKSKGPIFSSKNTKFMSSVPKLKVPKDDSVVSNGKSLQTNGLSARGKHDSQDDRIGSPPGPKKAVSPMSDSSKGSAISVPSTRPPPTGNRPLPSAPAISPMRKKTTPSIFLPRRPLNN